nr:recombinase family protein [Streptomyces sp. NBC_00830]
MITVGVCTRMSQDDALGDLERGRRGVRQQLDDSQKLSSERGWLIGKVYEDNDISAFKGHRNRPAFDELLRDLADGIGDWEPVVDAAEWRQVIDLLDGRRKQKERAPHSTQPRHFLSGIARCGHYGRAMRPNPYAPGSSPAEKYGYRYQCRAADGGCGGMSRIGPLVDETVESAFLKRLRHLGNAARRDIEECVPTFEERRSALATRAAERFVELRTAEARRHARAQSLPALAEDWEGLPVAVKRSSLLEWVSHVVVHPAGRGKRFDPGLIEIRWRPSASRGI